jgi:NAD+ kinase
VDARVNVPAGAPADAAEPAAVSTVGILANPHYPKTWALAQEIERALASRRMRGIHVTQENTLSGQRFDTLITLGGDGTMLRAAHMVAEYGTPILGIHMGRLGFLAEVPAAEWEQSLDRIAAQKFWLEERSMLCCRLRRDKSESGPWDALNEVVIGRGGISHVVHLATHVDGGYFTTYVADGLIVSTATGSTAYALSAGGPILPPELHNMLLVPICPHLSLDRTVVLPQGAVVTIRVESAAQGVVVVDGTEQARLQVGDEIELTTSPHVTRFVRLYDRREVYETLSERLKPRKVIRPHE